MRGKEFQCALARQRRCSFVEGAPLVAVKAVIGVIHMHADIAVGLAKGFNALERNPVVLVAKMRHHRALGLTGGFFLGRHAAAVIGHGR